MAPSRARTLELAVLGALSRAPLHGYELRRQLSSAGTSLRNLSFGSLYPALRRLTAEGLVTSADVAGRGSRRRITYSLTHAGRDFLAGSLNTAEPAAWEDSEFDVRFALFGTTDPATRLQILEGRRMRMLERVGQLRASLGRASRRIDAYTAELARHGLDQAEREVEWLERVIDTERGTRGAHDYSPEPLRLRSTQPPSQPDSGAEDTTSKEHP